MHSYSNREDAFRAVEARDFEIRQIKGTQEEQLWNDCIEKYHYFGNKRQNGHYLKYLIYNKGKIVAATSWKAGCRDLRVRDYFIGWSCEQRIKYNKHIVNNSRFLILPDQSKYNLGSYLMSKSLELLHTDWEEYFGYEPWLVESFVDERYFDGALYKASHWKHIGQTSGFGKGRKHNYHGNIKEVYVYELTKKYRDTLGCTTRNYNPLHSPPKWILLMEEFKMIVRSEKWKPGVDPDIEINEKYMNNLSDELEKFHGIFSSCYTRKEQEIHGLVYLTGLFSSLPRKSTEPIALNFSPNSSVRGLQRFMKDSVWDTDKMQRIHQSELLSVIGDTNGMITLDPSDIAKKGMESVGVHRQYCGSTGKIDNCQCGIHLGYTSDKGYGLIKSQLYIPEKWFDEEYEDKRNKTMIPDDLEFKTKNMIASELINSAFSEGVMAQWIGVDSAFGSDINFLNSLPKDKWYYAGIRSNEQVFVAKESAPKGLGTSSKTKDAPALTGESISVTELSKKSETIWRDVILGEGAKGPIISGMAFHRVYLSRSKKPAGEEVWLIMREHSDGQIRYSISNAPNDLPKVEIIKASTMRWPIEQCFGDGKGYLGMDQYEHRSWPAWHRHMTFVSVGLHLLLKLRLDSPSKKKLHF